MAIKSFPVFSFFLVLLFFTSSAIPNYKFPPKVPPPNPFCPRDTLKLSSCAELLGGMVNLVVGPPPKGKCCSLLKGLVDWEAAACLCTAIKANVLGANLDVPIALTLLVDECKKKIPDGFKCV
ncbi:proline-rich protein DC2-15 [Nymphaea thermarum]|nr:proline-rich protein DC2-15 [Nymphaea thermarum]